MVHAAHKCVQNGVVAVLPNHIQSNLSLKCRLHKSMASNVLANAAGGEGELNMTATNALNDHVQRIPDDALADSNFGKDETDDLEEFPVLLQSCDVRELIEVARKRGLSATGLARRLVHDFLRQTRGILLVGHIATSEGRS
jgi:hypothetical protein